MKKNKKGFTLIELLIVVAIITILAAGVVVGINPARHFRDTRNATRLNQMSTIAGAIYSYAVENGGAFPTGCPPDLGTTSVFSTACTTTLVALGYISSIPVPPLVGNGEDYVLKKTSSGGIQINSTASEANPPVVSTPIQVIQ